MTKKLKFIPLATLASLIMAAPAAMAQAQSMAQARVQDDPATDGLHVRAILGVEHDSNVLRVPSSAGPISDTAVQAGIGLSFNKRYSQQRVRADIEANTFRYQDQSGLNYNTVNYSLAWDWRVTSRLRGTVSADRRQFREVTADPLFATNLVGRRTERNELIEGVFEFGGPWRALAGVQHTRSQSTEPRSWDASPDITYAYAGLGYEFPSGTLITGKYRRGEGEYTDPTFTSLVSREFRDHETELGIRWPLTAKTSLDARIAHRKRDHSGAPALDFSGMVGNATVAWEITGKTRLVAGVIRDLSASGLPTGGHVESTRFYVAPVWQATGKTSFTARYDHTVRDWDNVVPASINFGRKETIDAASVGADWEALRWLTVSPYVRYERQKSSVANGYRATVFGVAAKAKF